MTSKAYADTHEMAVREIALDCALKVTNGHTTSAEIVINAAEKFYDFLTADAKKPSPYPKNIASSDIEF